MKEQARKRFSWATVARQWTEEYFGAAGGAAAARDAAADAGAARGDEGAADGAARARARRGPSSTSRWAWGRRRRRPSRRRRQETAADETAAEEERLERELVELRAERPSLEARVRSLEALYG